MNNLQTPNDINLPLSFNKDFIQKTSDSFIINAINGGDFFPNKKTILISIISVILFLLSIPLFFIVGNMMWIVFVYYFLAGILIYYLFKKTDVKTQFIFSSNGLNINSKKGSLFIQKENFDDIHVEFDKFYSMKLNHTFFYYHIVFSFKTPIYIPYTGKTKEKINFVNDYSFVDDKGKDLAFYIVKEIKKALDIK